MAGSSADGQAGLNGLVASSLALLDCIASSLGNDTKTDHSASLSSSSSSSSATPPDVFGLAKNAAYLVRLHAAKLSVLVVNEPFTLSAVASALRALTEGPVLILASACELCDASLYTRVIRESLVLRCAAVLRALRPLLVAVPADGKALVGDAKESTIRATGILWAQCDELAAFAGRGFGANLVLRVEQWCAQLHDALEELREWKDDLQDGDEADEDEDHDDEEGKRDDGLEDKAVFDPDVEGDDSADLTAEEKRIIAEQAVLDELMAVQTRLPRGDPDKIRPRLDNTLRRLRLTMLLYQGVIKRRLKPLSTSPPAAAGADTVGQQTGAIAEDKGKNPSPSSSPQEEGTTGTCGGGTQPSIASRLDAAMALCKRIPEQINELAFAFYNLDTAAIDPLVDRCLLDALAVTTHFSEPLVMIGGAERDKFSDWLDQFQSQIKKP